MRAADHETLLLVIGVAGLLALGAGLAVRWSAAVACGVALLGAEQAVRLATGPKLVDTWTPLYAGGLLLVAELAWWSLEPRVAAAAEPGAALRRLAGIALACAVGGGLAAVVVLAAGVPLHGGFALELVGVVAAIAALALVAGVARTRVG